MANEEYVIVNKTDLVLVADTVRSLVNSTDAMSLSGMKSKLNTAKSDIDNIFTALESKGITITDSTSLSDISSLVEQIEITDISPFTSIKCGSITPNFTKTLTIEGLSNCKIFAIRCVEQDGFYSEETNHIVLGMLANTEASLSDIGAIKELSAYFHSKALTVISDGVSSTISGNTLTFDYWLHGTYEYVMVSK